MIVREDLNPAQPIDLEKPKQPLKFPQFPVEHEEQQAERRVAFMLRPLSTMLAIAFLLEAAWINWKPDTSEMIYQVALVNAIFFFALRLIIGKFQIPTKFANPIATVASLVAISYSIIDLNKSATPWSTTQILIILLVGGFIFSSRSWFTTVSILTCMGWFWVALPHLTDDSWIQMGGYLLVTVIWGTWFLEMRLRNLADFDRHSQEQQYAQVIEETQFFSKTSQGIIPWCPVCKASSDAVIRHDGAKIVDANPAAARMLQMDRKELEGLPIANVLAPEKREYMQETLRLGNFEPTETVAFKKDSTRFSVEMLNGGITVDQGGMLAMVLHDLSEREKTKESIAAASANANQLLRRQTDLAVLAGTPDTAENLDHIMHLIVTAAHNWLPSSLGVFLVLWDNQSQGFVVTATSAQGRLVTEKLAPAEDRASIIGWLTTHNESLIVPKMADDPFNIRVLYPYQSVEAFAAFPVAGTAGVMGFLLVLESAPREFPPSDVEYLAILTHRATTACIQVTLLEQLAYSTGGGQ